MNAEIHFAGNYRDMCQQYGTSAGFQFEFSCARCQSAWRSPFVAYAGGRVAGWLGRGVNAASGLLGRAGGEITTAVEGLAGAGWGTAKDAAFRRAAEEAERHLSRCARCTSYVCDQCWDAAHGLCRGCAPDTAAEVAAARQRGLNETASEAAHAAGQSAGRTYDAVTERQLVCPGCRAQTRGGRFCPACGLDLTGSAAACAGCSSALPPGAAFCPECGTRR